jgi:cytochrome c oxidase assembly protein subunit 11
MEQQTRSEAGQEKKLNAQMLGKLLVIAVMMFGFGYALVPVYKKICEITGINVLTPMLVTEEEVRNI